MGCGGSNTAHAERLEIFEVPSHLVGKTFPPKCKRHNGILVIPLKLKVPGIMAHDAGSDQYESMSASPASELNSDCQKERSLADQLGYPEYPNYESIQAHIERLDTFLGEVEAQPMRFAELIKGVRSQMNDDGRVQSDERKDLAEAISLAISHHSGHAERNPSKMSSGPPSEDLSCATTATSRTIDEKDWWSMDFRTDEQIKRIRDMAQPGASKPRMLTQVRVSGKQSANAV